MRQVSKIQGKTVVVYNDDTEKLKDVFMCHPDCIPFSIREAELIKASGIKVGSGSVIFYLKKFFPHSIVESVKCPTPRK